MKSWIPVTVSLLAGLVCLSGCAVSGDFAFGGAKYERTIEKTFETGDGGTLNLTSDMGSVNVQSHTGDDVKITATLKARTSSESKAEEWFDRFEISFESNDGDVTVLGERKDQSFWRKVRMWAHYDIQVPKTYNLKIKTAGGSISISDLEGEADLHTSGGSITAGEISGPITARTSGGSIRLDDSDGPAELRTSGGSITVGAVSGPVDARTSGGSIRLNEVRGNVIARTSGGSIRADLMSQINEPAELRTSGGSIRIYVGQDFKAEIDAETSGGRVSCDLPVTVQGTIKKSRLHGKLNGGGPLVTLKTSGGSIYINEL